MQIIRPLSTQRISQPLAITLGNFDGVHRGHQVLVDQLIKQARPQGLLVGVLLFEPHANEYFAQKNQDAAPARLLGLADKIARLKQKSIDFIAIYPFNDHSITASAVQFIEDYLLSRFHVKQILVGDDFRFGAQRQGNVDFLRRYGEIYGFTVSQMPTYTETNYTETAYTSIDYTDQQQCMNSTRISSTMIRHLLHAGKIAQANALLGYDYFISGRVIQGKKLGRKMGTPTANIQYAQQRLALNGVYITWLVHQQQLYPSVTHIGYNKTLEQPADKLQVETHVLGQQIDLYGAKVRVHFVQKLREEKKFASIAVLQAAIMQDKMQALTYFDQQPRHTGL